MRTRRRLLAALGAGITVGTAGCGGTIGDSGPSESTETGRPTTETTQGSPPGAEPGTDTAQETDTPQSQDGYRFAEQIPIQGLTSYEQALEQTDTGQFNADEILNLLNGETNIDRQAELLGEVLDEQVRRDSQIPDKILQLGNAYHQAQAENPDADLPDMVFNANWGFDGDSGPLAQIHPVQNGIPQKPALMFDGYVHRVGQTQTQQGENTLAQYRDSDYSIVTRPQNMHSIRERIEGWRDDGYSEEEISEGRNTFLSQYNSGLFGNNDEKIRPLTYEDGEAVWINGSLHPELQRQYEDSEHYGNDEITTFEHEGDLEFEFESGETSMGAPLE